MANKVLTIKCLSGDGDRVKFINKHGKIYIEPRALTEVVIGKKEINKIIMWLLKVEAI